MNKFKSLMLSGLIGSACFAQTVTSDPVGVVTLTVQPGTGSARTTTTMALPLYAPSTSLEGNALGVINGVTSNTITVTDAGWTPGELSTAASPYCIRITSGAAEGRVLLISTSTSNTANTLTVDLVSSNVTSLTSLGIVTSSGSEDTFEIIECDTLSSFFGEPTVGGVIGGSTDASADIVYLFLSGSWTKFYFDTDDSNWVKPGLFASDASNQVILPDSGLLYSRLAAQASEFITTGTVPNTQRQVSINKSGNSFVGSSWPVDITLSETGFENVTGWVSSSNSSSADTVVAYVSGAWKTYYHDGSDWRLSGLFSTVSNDVVIPAGSAVLLSKKVATASNGVLVQALPYTL